VPSDHLGLKIEPSHCVRQGIDYVKAVYDFGSKIFHVHATDMEIRQNVFDRVFSEQSAANTPVAVKIAIEHTTAFNVFMGNSPINQTSTHSEPRNSVGISELTNR
jgi:sugar phosphate isomerase/epimerase